jgi:crossover junction endodeoxyribonuclease RuvC
MIVIGIDPGMAETGFGVLAVAGSRLTAIEHGAIATAPSERPEQRLAHINVEVAALLERHGPDAVALEDLYVGRNPRTILSVGQARGAVLTACGVAGVEAHGYAPAEIKNAVCGFGRADKGQMLRMVSAILGLDPPPETSHAADALAAGVCHAQMARTRRLRVELAR